MATFNPPYVERASHDDNLRFKVRHGISVYRISGVWQQQENPPSADHDAADRFFLGGHVYIITPAEQAELIAAGYGAYIT